MTIPADIPTITTIANLRTFGAVSQYVGYNVFLCGGSIPGDGYQGTFRVTTSNPGTDDGDNFIYSNTSGYYFVRQTGSGQYKYIDPSSSAGNIQASITAASGGGIVFRPGTYPNANYVFPSNIEVLSAGPVLFQTSSNTLPIFDLTSSSNIKFNGIFKLQGSSGASNTGQVGIKFYNTNQVDIGGILEIININGYGIEEQAPASSFHTPASNNFNGVRVHGNYFGKYIHNFAEYSTDIGGFYYGNIAAISCESGNRTFIGCNLIDNTYGYFFQQNAAGNSGHGNIVGGAVNHNITAFTFDNIPLGYLVSGTQVIATASSSSSLINVINGSKLIQFSNCGLGANLNVDATSECSIQSCGIRTDLSGYAVPNITAGGIYIGKNNFNAAGVLGTWNN